MVKIEQHKICFEIIYFKNLVDKNANGQEDGEVGVAESISKRWVGFTFVTKQFSLIHEVA